VEHGRSVFEVVQDIDRDRGSENAARERQPRRICNLIRDAARELRILREECRDLLIVRETTTDSITERPMGTSAGIATSAGTWRTCSRRSIATSPATNGSAR